MTADQNDNRFPFPRKNQGTFIIAEAGTGHGGSLTKGKELIRAAAEAGADCVKFQMVYADEIIHPNTGAVPLPGGQIPLYEQFRKLEKAPAFFAALKEETESQGMTFLCTPFGTESARQLRFLGVEMFKIASPELNHLPLIRKIAAYGIPLILSTGVSTLGDIEEALAEIRQSSDTPPHAALLHCVTSYPAPAEEYNISLIPLYRSVFGVTVGVSDHSSDPELIPSLAVAAGAEIIEKHICLSRRDGGLDDPIALEPDQFRVMTASVRNAGKIARDRGFNGLKEELAVLYGRNRIEAAWGTGKKELAPSERENYGRTNRSIHALTELKAGDILTTGNTAILRTEKVLTPGLHPRWYETILGRKVNRTVEEGEGIIWDDLLA